MSTDNLQENEYVKIIEACISYLNGKENELIKEKVENLKQQDPSISTYEAIEILIDHYSHLKFQE